MLLHADFDSGSGLLTLEWDRAVEWIGPAAAVEVNAGTEIWNGSGGPTSGDGTTTLVIPCVYNFDGPEDLKAVDIAAGFVQAVVGSEPNEAVTDFPWPS